ncbi:unnamed protein product, partial [Scytosiphon promiscuus]
MPTQIAQMEMDQPVELIQPLQEEQQDSGEVMDIDVQQGSAGPLSSAAAPATTEPASAQSLATAQATEQSVEGGSEGKQESSTRTESLAQDPESAIKFLVPNYLAGSLIGKKGATIKDIQLKTSCMVRIATSGMYYPGTMERAVLVAGDVEGVKKACSLILHTLHVPDNNESGCAKLVSQEKADTVEVTQRMLIPLTAGGLVIGRKGANITALLEASGAKVALGQKADVKVHERLVTVQGKLTAANKAVEMLVDKLMEEPVLSRFANLSVNYRGHGSSQSKASMAAGIAPAPLPYQRVPRGGSPPPEEDSDAGATSDSASVAPTTPATAAAGPAPAVPTVAAAPSPLALPAVVGVSATSSPATSAAGRRVASPPRFPSPARTARGARGGGRVAVRGYGSGGVGSNRFHPQQYRQQPMHQQQQPHRHQQHQQPHRHQQHQQHQRFPMSPARITPPPPPQMQMPQQPQPGSMMVSLPMGPGGMMMPGPMQMGPMGPISHGSVQPVYPMAYAGGPAGAVYHPAGVQAAPPMPGPVATVGGDGQPRGYASM